MCRHPHHLHPAEPRSHRAYGLQHRAPIPRPQPLRFGHASLPYPPPRCFYRCERRFAVAEHQHPPLTCVPVLRFHLPQVRQNRIRLGVRDLPTRRQTSTGEPIRKRFSHSRCVHYRCFLPVPKLRSLPYPVRHPSLQALVAHFLEVFLPAELRPVRGRRVGEVPLHMQRQRHPRCLPRFSHRRRVRSFHQSSLARIKPHLYAS